MYIKFEKINKMYRKVNKGERSQEGKKCKIGDLGGEKGVSDKYKY